MVSRYEEFMKSQPYLPFRVGYLTEAMVAKAEKELGETDEVKAKTIPELRKLIAAEPNFSIATDEAYLLQFLRPRKFDVKRAFALLQSHFYVKRMCSDLYDHFDADSLRKMYGLKTNMCLPYRDEEGCVVMLLRMRNWNTDICGVGDFLTALTATIFLCEDDPATQVCGVRILIDVGGMRIRQAKSLTPRSLYVIGLALRSSIQARYKGIHIYNESAVIPYLWSILKLFLTEKVKNRVHFHGDNQKQLHKFIPKAILPVEYGGEYPGDVADWFNGEVEKFFGRYAELVTYGYKK